MKQNQIEKHSTTQSVILHLLPGILVGCFFLLARQPVANMGYPSSIALILAYAFILIPVELGYLVISGKEKDGSLYITGDHQLSKFDPVVAISCLGIRDFYCNWAIVTLLKPVDAFLQERLFFWMPDINYGLDGNYSRRTLIVTYSLVFIFIAVLDPVG